MRDCTIKIVYRTVRIGPKLDLRAANAHARGQIYCRTCERYGYMTCGYCSTLPTPASGGDTSERGRR